LLKLVNKNKKYLKKLLIQIRSLKLTIYKLFICHLEIHKILKSRTNINKVVSILSKLQGKYSLTRFRKKCRLTHKTKGGVGLFNMSRIKVKELS
jgi:ribosomal protein S14